MPGTKHELVIERDANIPYCFIVPHQKAPLHTNKAPHLAHIRKHTLIPAGCMPIHQA
jgi:hypothetical protein